MTKRDAKRTTIAALDGLAGDDNEAEHLNAEAYLMWYLEHSGSKDVADAYKRARARCGFWYA